MTSHVRHWPVGATVQWRPTKEHGRIVRRDDDGVWILWTSGAREKIAFEDPRDVGMLVRWGGKRKTCKKHRADTSSATSTSEPFS